MSNPLSQDFIAQRNAALGDAHREDLDAISRKLARRGIAIEEVLDKARRFAVAVPSWGVGTGGTRFARFPGPGEPRNVFDKIEDCGVIHKFTRVTPLVSPHFPWDKVSDYSALRDAAAAQGLGFDAVNSNTFQDQAGQKQSYKFGSLSHTDEATRQQAIDHNLECIEIGQKIGSKALTVWIGDGSNFPGQANLTKAFDRYLDAARHIYAALPHEWQMFLEHKFYEPAFYSTVISDWGSSYLAATELGPKASCLVDLGHHAPNVNIEQIVSRLIRFGKLGGFHFNDSKYGDDDLDAGSVDPFRLFLVFNELADAELRQASGFKPSYMIDQSHNVTDPIESLMQSAIEIARANLQSHLVDRTALQAAQESNDVLQAHRILKDAFLTDVSPLLAEARLRDGGALDPISAYRASGYRAVKERERPEVAAGSAGIV
jgi:L-rhamnose isomerase / sugar isomerase